VEREQPTRSSWAPFPSPIPAVGAEWWGKEEHTIRQFIHMLSHFAKAKEKKGRETERKNSNPVLVKSISSKHYVSPCLTKINPS